MKKNSIFMIKRESLRKEVLADLNQLVEAGKFSRYKYMEVRSAFSTRLGLHFERRPDVWEKHLHDNKYFFLTKHRELTNQIEGAMQEIEDKDSEQYKRLLKELKSVKNGSQADDFKTKVSKTMGTIIEGDNLGVLFLLKNIYATKETKVDFIYIDPPYNNGENGFIYNNDYRVKGTDKGLYHVDEKNNFYHSNWLSMMESRLNLTHSLLKDTGLIAISIDDYELYHLKLLMDKVFGTNCYKGTIVWKKGSGMWVNSSKTIRKNHEYVLIYEKVEGRSCFNSFWTKGGKEEKFYSLITGGKKGDYYPGTSLWYSIKDPLTNEDVYPFDGKGKKKTWNISLSTYKEELAKGNIVWKADRNGRRMPHRWIIQKAPDSYLKSVIDTESVPGSGSGQGSVGLTKDFAGKKDVFDYPKPINLIKHLIKYLCPQDGLVLDFFAGSGTTGCAVADLNKKDGGSRHFVLITNNDGDRPERIKNGQDYCVFRDVLYPRLERNKEKYALKINTFILNHPKMWVLKKGNESFETRSEEIVQTGICLLAIRFGINIIAIKEAMIAKGYWTGPDNQKYGFGQPGLNVDLRYEFNYRGGSK